MTTPEYRALLNRTLRDVSVAVLDRFAQNCCHRSLAVLERVPIEFRVDADYDRELRDFVDRGDWEAVLPPVRIEPETSRVRPPWVLVTIHVWSQVENYKYGTEKRCSAAICALKTLSLIDLGFARISSMNRDDRNRLQFLEVSRQFRDLSLDGGPSGNSDKLLGDFWFV